MALSLKDENQPLLPASLFFHQGHTNDIVYGAWEEDGVCGGGDMMIV